MTKIATHNKIFHADEVTAIALLEVFTEEEYIVQRVDHDTTNFADFDMVIDIGKKYDGEKYFDHHQYKGGKSSAGLIWSYLEVEEDYPKISKFIKQIDDHDTGVQKAKEFEYSNLISCYNSDDINDPQKQDEQFKKAVEFAKTVLDSFATMEENLQEAKSIVARSYTFDNNRAILELETFTPHWTTYINGMLTPHIKAVVWEDEAEKNWKVKIPAKKLGSYELVTKPLEDDGTMEFVHSSGFYAIAKDEETMKKFLAKQIR